MNLPLDITGQRYGRLIAIQRVPNHGRRTAWLFQCDCGARVELQLENVRAGITSSCGCLRIDVTRARSLTHGHHIGRRESRTLKSYTHAKARCFNVNDPKYPQYGGRGITMCPEWAQNFETFLRDMGECPPGRTLDRVNVHGHYEPRNCRWATPAQQARTRTDNVLVIDQGQTMILKDFAARVGVNYKKLSSTMRRLGIDAHEAAGRLKS